MKSTHRRPVRSAAPVTRKVSTRTSVYGRTSVFTVAWCWTATITLRSTFLTEGSDGAYANLHPRVRSGVLLREAPAFMRGESSQWKLVFKLMGSVHIIDPAEMLRVARLNGQARLDEAVADLVVPSLDDVAVNALSQGKRP